MSSSELDRRRFLRICTILGLTAVGGVVSRLLGEQAHTEAHNTKIRATAMAYEGDESTELIEAIRQSMAMIGLYYETPEGKYATSGGTGVFVFKEGGRAVLLTNAHVIEEDVPPGSKLISLGLGEATNFFSDRFDFVVNEVYGNLQTVISETTDLGFVGFRYAEPIPVLDKWKPIGVDWKARPDSVGKMATVVYQDEFDRAGAKRGIPIPCFELLRDEDGGIETGNLVDFTLDYGSSGTPAVSIDTGKVVGIFPSFFYNIYDQSAENASILFLGDTDAEQLFGEILRKLG